MSRSHTVTPITKRDTIRGAALKVALAAGLAVSAVGCATGPTRHAYAGASATGRLAARSGVTVDPNQTVGRYDAAWYAERANAEGLPPLWLGEAVQATAETRAARARAIAARVAAHADENKALAQAEAQLRQAIGAEQIAVADAQGLRQALDARLDELTTGVAARESAIESEARLNDANVRSMVEERQAAFEAMRSQAVAEFERAQAEHERMLAERAEVQAAGQTDIRTMTQIADLTEQRAQQKVASLRAQADAVRQQSEALVQDLSQRIDSLTEQIGAESSSLRARSASLAQAGQARHDALLAEAEALAARDGEHEVAQRTIAAQSALAQAKARFAEAQQQADAVMDETKGSIERMRAEAEKFLLITDADYQQQIAATKRFREHNLADVFVGRAKADRIEREAREEFVKAQAAALARAGREEAAHLSDLAQKQFEELKAQAEADAARIRAEVTAALAQQMAQNSTELPGKTEGLGAAANGADTGSKKKSGKNAKNPPNGPADAQPPATPNDPTFAQTPAPAQPQVAAKPAVVEPEHVAAFKVALAEATRLRAEADAKERALLATYEERMQTLEAWRRQQDARHEQMITEVGVFAQQATVKADAIRAKAEKTLRLAQAEHDSAVADAEAFRYDTQARITTLRAEAQRVLEESEAESSRLLAQAEAVDAGGAAELRALEAQRAAAQTRGEAEARALIAEAAAVEAGQGAQVAQMRQEIASAERILRAELARLDQAAESFIQIARASYDEAVTLADAFAEKTRIASARMTIDNEVSRKIALAAVEHQRNLVNAEDLAGQAEVERRLALAAASREQAEAEDIARRAGVYARSQGVEARVNTALVSADAQDENVRAVFESRIASVQADRDRAFAHEYLSDAQRQARLAKAQAAAAAYRDLSQAAVALLSEKQQAFERSARVNWDARLAMPASDVELEWPTLDPSFPSLFDGEPAQRPAFANVNEDGSVGGFDN